MANRKAVANTKNIGINKYVFSFMYLNILAHKQRYKRPVAFSVLSCVRTYIRTYLWCTYSLVYQVKPPAEL